MSLYAPKKSILNKVKCRYWYLRSGID